MFTPLSRSTPSDTTSRARKANLKATSTLALESLDKRRMLTSWTIPFPPTPFGSMPAPTTSYSIPSSWSMPSFGTTWPSSSSFTPSVPNTFGQGTSFFQPFATISRPGYSTSDFFQSSSFATPTFSPFGSGNFSTPTFTGYGPFGSANVVTTRPGSQFAGATSPVIFLPSGGGVGAGAFSSLAQLQSSYNQLQRLNNQLQSIGGTPVGIPSSVTSMLAGYSDDSSWSGSSAQPRTYTQAEMARLVTGGDEIVLVNRPTFSGSGSRAPDRGDRMIKTAAENLFGMGGIVDSVSRTSRVINRVAQSGVKLVQPLSSLIARTGGGFTSTAIRRR